MLKANLRMGRDAASIRPPVHGTDTMHAPAMSAKTPPSQRPPQPGSTAPDFRHEPVLLDAVLAQASAQARLVVDCTVGGGGHAQHGQIAVDARKHRGDGTNGCQFRGDETQHVKHGDQ